MSKSTRDWKLVQHDYDVLFLTKKQIKIKYKISSRSIKLAIKRGDLVFRSQSETKQIKLSGQIIPDGHKWCNSCKQVLLKVNFNKKNIGSKNRLQPYCIGCSKKHSSNHYNSNKKKHIANVALTKKKNTKTNEEKIWELLTSCVVCRETNPLVLVFDHIIRSSKKEDISTLFLQGSSWQMIETELDKCQVLCCNCHAIKTHEENNSWRWKKLLLKTMNEGM